MGYYWAECCLLDCAQIETHEDLEDVLARTEDNEEIGPVMVFATLPEAIEALASAWSPDEQRTEFARLGYVAPGTP